MNVHSIKVGLASSYSNNRCYNSCSYHSSICSHCSTLWHLAAIVIVAIVVMEVDIQFLVVAQENLTSDNALERLSIDLSGALLRQVGFAWTRGLSDSF